jgi:lipopolysaccharide export system protein LptA
MKEGNAVRVIYNEGEHIEVIENVQKVEAINNTGRVLHYTTHQQIMT